MGVNFYLRWTEDDGICECCGSRTEIPHELHMGKSSFGWRYLLRGHGGLDLDSLLDWLEFIHEKRGDIYDEYGSEVSLEEWLTVVFRSRSRDQSPEDLLRHGDPEYHLDLGAYDLSYREFS